MKLQKRGGQKDQRGQKGEETPITTGQRLGGKQSEHRVQSSFFARNLIGLTSIWISNEVLLLSITARHCREEISFCIFLFCCHWIFSPGLSPLLLFFLSSFSQFHIRDISPPPRRSQEGVPCHTRGLEKPESILGSFLPLFLSPFSSFYLDKIPGYQHLFLEIQAILGYVEQRIVM